MSQSKEENQSKSIKKEVSLAGIGLHSGEKGKISFLPSEKGKINFILGDKEIEASSNNVTTTNRGTNLGEIQTIEHVLAAAYGLGIDSLEIKLSTPEPPAMDGSALFFVKALLSAGIKILKKKKTIIVIKKTIEVKERESSIKVIPYDGFCIDFEVDFPAFGKQHFIYNKNTDFIKEVAPARTFGYIEEVEMFKKNGIAKGASTKNALVLSKNSYVNKPRFKDEMVRHKILDLIGDLALLQAYLKAKIIAKKSGHKLNVQLTNLIRLESQT